jgi:hypothetical protein
MFEHITFSMEVRNVDINDPRFGTCEVLTFGGIHYDINEGETIKDIAVMHMAFNVVNNKNFVAEFGKTYPVPSTFTLLNRSIPSDQGMR